MISLASVGLLDIIGDVQAWSGLIVIVGCVIVLLAAAVAAHGIMKRQKLAAKKPIVEPRSTASEDAMIASPARASPPALPTTIIRATSQKNDNQDNKLERSPAIVRERAKPLSGASPQGPQWIKSSLFQDVTLLLEPPPEETQSIGLPVVPRDPNKPEVKSSLKTGPLLESRIACSNCGEDLPGHPMRFCPNCGVNIVDADKKLEQNIGTALNGLGKKISPVGNGKSKHRLSIASPKTSIIPTISSGQPKAKQVARKNNALRLDEDGSLAMNN